MDVCPHQKPTKAHTFQKLESMSAFSSQFIGRATLALGEHHWSEWILVLLVTTSGDSHG